MAFLRLTALTLLLLIVSCSDDGSKPSSRAELLAGTDPFGKAWQITGIEVSLSGLNGEFSAEECLADNIIRYYPDGEYEVTDIQKCHPDDPASLTGSWFLMNNETTLVINLPDSTITWGIVSLNEQTQEISADFQEGSRIYTLSSSN